LDTVGVFGTVSGSVAETTCGSAATFFIAVPTAADWSATVPVPAWKTIWPP
jgi:hypothetical protein